MASMATPTLLDRWLSIEESPIAGTITKLWEQCLQAYRAQPTRVEEDYRREWATSHGAYKGRQLFELVQNGADAMIEAGIEGRIEIIVTPEALYCANEGAPIDVEGATALLHSHMSRKRDDQIGHFGLGFKSVLAVTKEPKFFSRSGCFEFDGIWAADQIRRVVRGADGTPTLRFARMLQPNPVAQADSELAQLMQWATTVVKLPCHGAAIDQLVEAALEFPVEFLLFTKNVREILITIKSTGKERRLKATRDVRGTFHLADGNSTSSWRLFEREYVPTGAEAIQESERPIIPLAWAVPLNDASTRGQFWSFFPTNDESTLRGILNAGWKTSMDRHSLLRNPLNSELLAAFADLVADSLPQLFQPSDPAAHLDCLPARDSKGWVDEELANCLFPRLKQRALIPDGNAALRQGLDLKLPPAGVPEEVMGLWARVEPTPPSWTHTSIERKDRRYRASRLGADTQQGIGSWLDAMVIPPTPGNSKLAVIAAVVLIGESRFRDHVRRAKVILTAANALAAPDPSSLFLGADAGADVRPERLVHPELRADPQVCKRLTELGIRDLDDLVVLDGILRANPIDWNRFWATLRRLPSEVASNRLQELTGEGRLHVRTAAGTFALSSHVLLPGPVVPGPDKEDAAYCLGVEYHRGELETLTQAGLVAEPRPAGARLSEAWYQDYLRFVHSWFQQECEKQGRQKPRGYLVKADPMPTAGPLEPLKVLSPAGRATLTERLLPLAAKDVRWKIHHETRSHSYPSLHLPPPSTWMLAVHGCLWTSLGPHPVGHAVGSELAAWEEFFPVWNRPGSDFPTWCLPTSLEAVGAVAWEAALKRTIGSEAIVRVGELYVKAAEHGVAAPEVIRCRTGSGLGARAPSEVYVAQDGVCLESLAAQGLAALPVPGRAAAEILIRAWGLGDASMTETGTVGYVQSGVPAPASDLFPALSDAAGPRAALLELVPCSELWLSTPTPSGLQTEPHEYLEEAGHLYFLDTVAAERLLEVACDLLGIPCDERAQQTALNQDLRARVHAAPTVEAKLAMLGGIPGLRRCVPSHIVEVAEAELGELQPEQLASLAYALHGVSVLRELRGEMVAAGLAPPHRWNGGDAALEFVRILGFPDPFAGTPKTQRPPWFDVQGPITLKPLHQFQDAVASRLRSFLQESERGRGLLSLPTGAGKTRVVVQALVDGFQRGQLNETILWIADRQELCEQAVQTWSDVWRARGPDKALRISRLWGATNNRVRDLQGRPHLVVATYQSLKKRLDDEFAWLSQPDCIVVDEAHGSTAPSYTEILEWLGLDWRHTKRRLIGLTATPFRGGSDDAEETARLVKRYGSRRFDHNIFNEDDPYPILQGMGVLAFVDHQVLPGINIRLRPDEMEHLRTFREMPASAESRLGQVVERNQSIVEAIAGLPAGWPVLVFGLSVDHAELLAGLLSLRGIKAAAISSRTQDSTRWHAIRAFKDHDIRVLTNYGVLTTGFDAPGIRALFVTRPVYSPGLYQQMIGRGLRGPLNGGKPRCLIVNVEDNVIEYGERLAFHYFEYLWK